jgi:hypothetical protein
MTSSFRYAKHFLVTWENGKFLVAQAREIVPYRTYEIIQSTKPPYEMCLASIIDQKKELPNGIGLGESLRKKHI